MSFIRSHKNAIVYYLFLSVVILYSFFSFSEVGYYNLNSDDALNVLMAWKFDIPGTLYCWGQDRGGSFIPMIAHVVIFLTGMKPIWATAIVHYLLNTFGFLGFAQFIKSRWLKFILAMVWFFPTFYFSSFLRYPMGTQYCLIGISLLFYNLYFNNPSVLKQMLYYSIFCLFLIAAMWASDLAIINIGCLALAISYFAIKRKGWVKYIFSLETVITGLAIKYGVEFILYGKEHAVKNESYSVKLVNTFSEIIDALSIVGQKLVEALSFSLGNYIMSIYAWLVFFTIVLCKILVLKNRKLRLNNWFVLFLLLNLVAIGGALFTANWVYEYGEMNRRYFVTIYIAIGLLIIYFVDQLRTNNVVLHSLLFSTAVVGIWSAKNEPIQMGYESKYKELSAFESIIPAGLIGSYWDTYILDVYDPDQLLAAPRDGAGNRNNAIVDEVFEYDDIYLIKNNWLDTFPTYRDEYGYRLRKNGEPFQLLYFELCKYKRVLYDTTFFPNQFNKKGELRIDSNGIEYIQSHDTINKRLFTMGPYTLLGKGKYQAVFKMKYENNSSFDNQIIGKVDVTSEWGKNYIKVSDIDQNKKDSNGFITATIDFEISKFERDIELKIWPQFGENDRMMFYQVRLKQKEL